MIKKQKIILEIKNLSYKYNKKGPQILKNISLTFKKGNFITIIGPNGSGKSTLVKNIVGALNYKQGQINLEGKWQLKKGNYFKKQPKKLFWTKKEFAQKVAYIPQIIQIPNGISVVDFVSYGRIPYLSLLGKMSAKDHQIVTLAMREMGVEQWKDKMIEDLSGGQRQKVLAAMALAQESEIIILDEPTTYLDIRAQYELMELMKKMHLQGKTIIVVLHDLNQAIQYSDEVIVMQDGQIYAQGHQSKVITEQMIQQVYKIKTRLIEQGKNKYLSNVKLA